MAETASVGASRRQTPIALVPTPSCPVPPSSPSKFLSLCMCFSVSLFLSLCPSVAFCLSLSLSACLCLSTSACLCLSASACLCLSPVISVFLSLCLSVISLPVSVSVSPHHYPPLCLSLSLLSSSVCLPWCSRGRPFRGCCHQGFSGHGAVLPIPSTAPTATRARRPPVPQPRAALAGPWPRP